MPKIAPSDNDLLTALHEGSLQKIAQGINWINRLVGDEKMAELSRKDPETGKNVFHAALDYRAEAMLPLVLDLLKDLKIGDQERLLNDPDLLGRTAQESLTKMSPEPEAGRGQSGFPSYLPRSVVLNASSTAEHYGLSKLLVSTDPGAIQKTNALIAETHQQYEAGKTYGERPVYKKFSYTTTDSKLYGFHRHYTHNQINI